MAKQKKLSNSQSRRIKDNQNKRIAKAKQKKPSKDDLDDSMLGPQCFGQVVTRYGQHADVESSEGELIRCNIRRAVSSLVCGDKVIWRPYKVSDSDFNGVIEAVEPRDSVFVRPDFYDGLKPVAANIDQIFIVSALLPDLAPSIIDRYLVAVEQLDITPVILINKMDLLDDQNRESVESTVELYRSIGYQVLTMSAIEEQGIESVRELLVDKTSVFVGQSGVGKSSLVNSILPEVNILTKQVSDNSRLGVHTTTASRLYRLDNGGSIIDSPGVREFAMWHLETEQILYGFIEFRPFLTLCKFRDCKHQKDPGCALQQAIADKKISQQRYSSYKRILQTIDEITLRHQSKEPS
ncbi:MAG: ribosome biogenesis GTPase [Psychrosphaera sp.]|uniref:Small ribosomal subunit biogenesis GTPase RsgA n=1 Tax=Psychrosphaera aquimarina TaxID=2044854 RepID=A0ABU3R2I4_9GAMM|nr:small ribosomal subunit biogenesis GTPase RsgA [Psychrosphaera aquimarina]MBU2919413.1 small ribosomal subunit biogenesis GTPase RsgA [Psychrosphaera sp. F3M07]MDU0113744.1 small ribosomal subunit biogenesis GTPase RsgA [Psychrosphaera aquimarina]